MLDALAGQQARLLQHTIAEADIAVFQHWWPWFSLGGDVGQLEIQAYQREALHLPRCDRQLLDHAAYELINNSFLRRIS